MTDKQPPPAGGLDADNTPPRQRGRPWPKGTSGNPTGPRTGSRNKATLALDALAAGEASDVLRAMVDRAKAGDVSAATLILSRVWPARKGRPVELVFPPLHRAADLVAALAAVAEAMARGELSPDEAHLVADVLEVQRRSIETADLEQRLVVLETAQRQETRR
jgi:hypothetical protein